MENADRIIYPIDLNGENYQSQDDIDQLKIDALDSAKTVKGTGVTVKYNSVLRAVDYRLIELVHRLGLKFFADFKLNDISNTLANDAWLLKPWKPEIVTVMASTSHDPIARVKDILGDDTKVLAVTVLTTFSDADCFKVYNNEEVLSQVLYLAELAKEAGADGVVCAPTEASAVKMQFEGLDVCSANIRPSWIEVKGDDQDPNRKRTPEEAAAMGVDYFVIGRPIRQAEKPVEAIEMVAGEIGKGLPLWDQLQSGAVV